MHIYYIRSERNLWTVGFYKPDGNWEPESDHDSAEEAEARVSYLNGGGKCRRRRRGHTTSKGERR